MIYKIGKLSFEFKLKLNNPKPHKRWGGGWTFRLGIALAAREILIHLLFASIHIRIKS